MSTSPIGGSSSPLPTNSFSNTQNVKDVKGPDGGKKAKITKIFHITALVLVTIAALSLMITGFATGNLAIAIPGLLTLLVPIIAGCVRGVKVINAKRKKQIDKKPSKNLPAPVGKPTPFNPASINRIREAHLAPLQPTNPQDPAPWETLTLAFANSWGIEEQNATKFITVRNLKNGVRWTMVHHEDISIPVNTKAIDGGGTFAIVNSANKLLKQDIPGSTNSVLAKATSDKSWEASTENQDLLAQGKVTGGLWEARKQLPKGSIHPRALIQARAPVFSDPNTDMKQALDIYKNALDGIFEKAAELGCSHVQLELLGNHDEDSIPKSPIQQATWIAQTELALEQAINRLPADSIVRHVILVENNDVPSLGISASQYSPRIAKEEVHHPQK